MSVCAAKGCKNRSATKSMIQLRLEKTSKITFHAFPKNLTRRARWITAMGLNESKLPKQAALCSQHFKNEDIDRTLVSCANFSFEEVKDTTTSDNHSESRDLGNQLYTILTSDVIKHNKRHCLQIEKSEVDEPVPKVQTTVPPAETKSEIIEMSPTAKCSTSLYKLLLRKDASVQTDFSTIENEAGKETFVILITLSFPVNVPHTVEKCTYISPQKLFQFPVIEQLRKMLTSTKKKYGHEIKRLRQQNSRYSKKIATLKNVLKTLKKKNLLQTEEIDV